MERYETARLVISKFEEDVITASKQRTVGDVTLCEYDGDNVTVYYTDGTYDVFLGWPSDLCS